MNVANNQMVKVREEGGKMVTHNKFVGEQNCTFDRFGTRFEIHVIKINDTEYLVSVPNFYFSMTTPTPYDIAYKLRQRDVMSAVDAESVEIAIKHLMSL
jgi:hypothetical protein